MIVKRIAVKDNILRNNNGLTLGELLIVVAIIALIVAVAVPALGKQLEKSRESVDLANIRSKYTEVMTAVITDDADGQSGTVMLKQKQEDWQSADPVVIGGITHYKSEGDTPNWKGIPKSGGSCVISYDPTVGVIFKWLDKNGDENGGTNGGNTGSGTTINFKEDVHEALAKTGFMETYKGTTSFRIDSTCPNSAMVNAVKPNIGNDSLLKHGSWAYLGDIRETTNKCMYLFWTSVDTDKVGAGKSIPVIIAKEGGGYYVSETVTAQREKTYSGSNKIDTYVAVAGDFPNYSYYKDYTNGTKYDTLEDAYRAYEKILSDGKYTEYKDTLPK